MQGSHLEMKTDPCVQVGRAAGLAWDPEEHQLLRRAWREAPRGSRTRIPREIHPGRARKRKPVGCERQTRPAVKTTVERPIKDRKVSTGIWQ